MITHDLNLQNSRNLRVALYARVSTTEEAEMQNPETQLRILREYCSIMGYEIYDTFTDHKSGKDPNRPEFQRMMDLATRKRGRPFDAILCLRLDRFMRSAYYGLQATQALKDAGCGLIFVRDNIDTTTPSGEAFFTMQLAFAQFERAMTGKRVSEGVQRRISEGKGWGHRKCNPDLLAEYVRQHPNASISEMAREFKVSRATIHNNLGCNLTSPSEIAPALNISEGESSEVSTSIEKRGHDAP